MGFAAGSRPRGAGLRADEAPWLPLFPTAVRRPLPVVTMKWIPLDILLGSDKNACSFLCRLEHGSGWEVTWPRGVPGLLGMLVGTSSIPGKGPRPGATITGPGCGPVKAGPGRAAGGLRAALGRAGCLLPASWLCLPWGTASPPKRNSFFTVRNNPPPHWCAKSPPGLKHKPSYLISVSLHLYFQPGLILELGKRLIMDSVGQK